MGAREVWRRHSGRMLCETAHVRLHQDSVTGPGRVRGDYDWIETADQVRVLAVTDQQVLLIEQDHYLVGRTLQLPGGSVDPTETALDAAVRELAEETGMRGTDWRRVASLYALPGLSPARIHLWRAEGLSPGRPHRELNEVDVQVVRMALDQAVSP